MSGTVTFLDYVNEIPQDSVETQSVQYPWVQWVNGKPALKKAGGVAYTGGWFISLDNAGETPLAGWEKSELTHANGDSTPGWFARDIKIAVIHTRKRWVVGTNGQSQQFPWTEFDAAKAAGRPSGNAQILALVAGLEHLGPVIVTTKGSTSQAMLGSARAEGVMGAFWKRVIGTANGANRARGVKSSFAMRAFWMCVGPQRDAQGNPMFTTVGQVNSSTQVTLPTLIGVGDKPTVDEVGKLFVGKDLLTELNDLRTETQDWARAWDTMDPAPAQEHAEIPDVEKEDLPF